MTNKPSVADAVSALDTLRAYLLSVGASGVGAAVAAAATVLSPSEKIWVFPYTNGSKSAKALAEAAGGQRIKREGSNFIGKTGQFILNWGAGTGNFNAAIGEAKLLNPPKVVDIAINKAAFFKAMLGDGAPRVPFWTTSQQQAASWLSMGYTVIARDKLEGAKGEGLRVVKNAVDLGNAKLYTIKVPSITEYRVYIFNNRAVDFREKRLKTGMTADTDNMRHDENKYLFCEHVAGSNTTRLSNVNVPADVIEQAERAAKKLGLLTGGVDVLWDGSNAFVLEFNTAPYLGDHTAALYAKLLKEYVATA